MSSTQKSNRPLRFPPAAYEFLDQALRLTQKRLGKQPSPADAAGDESHISGRQLLDGVRELALREFGMMAISVFHHWGIRTTDDIGQVVWDMIERDDMRKTDRDQISDFFDVFKFDDVFDRDYQIDSSVAFRR